MKKRTEINLNGEFKKGRFGVKFFMQEDALGENDLYMCLYFFGFEIMQIDLTDVYKQVFKR